MAAKPDPLEVLRDLVARSTDLQETIRRLIARAQAAQDAARDEIYPKRECCPCIVQMPCTCACHVPTDEQLDQHVANRVDQVLRTIRRAGR